MDDSGSDSEYEEFEETSWEPVRHQSPAGKCFPDSFSCARKMYSLCLQRSEVVFRETRSTRTTYLADDTGKVNIDILDKVNWDEGSGAVRVVLNTFERESSGLLAGVATMALAGTRTKGFCKVEKIVLHGAGEGRMSDGFCLHLYLFVAYAYIVVSASEAEVLGDLSVNRKNGELVVCDSDGEYGSAHASANASTNGSPAQTQTQARPVIVQLCGPNPLGNAILSSSEFFWWLKWGAGTVAFICIGGIGFELLFRRGWGRGRSAAAAALNARTVSSANQIRRPGETWQSAIARAHRGI